MNTNLKIALLLGYYFDTHRIYHSDFMPEGLKVMDQEDYQLFNYNTLKTELILKIERHWGVEFEFQRSDKVWQMIDLFGRDVPNIKEAHGDTFEEMIKQAIELTFPTDFQKEMDAIKEKYPHHYNGILNASK